MFLGEKPMQTIPSVIPRKECLFFDLACCINELHLLRNDLSTQDRNEIEQAYKKLSYFIEDKQLQQRTRRN
ncbi:MAG: hypothetical protein H0U70_10115 [Tatlockia sp.]|nr:hypothetical protein [Tatlockia sp.]